jgi:hypothetical protein
VLKDLAALTPPLLVAIAFLIAAAAFVRHEMRRTKNPAEHEETDSSQDSAASPVENESDDSSGRRSLSENRSEDRTDRDH